MNSTALLDALFSPPPRLDGSEMQSFLRAAMGSLDATAIADPFATLVHIALRADRLSGAGAAGHQAAIRRLRPEVGAQEITAICISEASGPHPKGIESTLVEDGAGGYVLNGHKQWGTMAPDADRLLVAASIGWENDRNQVRMVSIPADRAGIERVFVEERQSRNELRICDLELTNVAIAAEEVDSHDAYDSIIKPFRIAEDVFGTVATHICWLRAGLEAGIDAEFLEDLIASILLAASLADGDMDAPSEIIGVSAWLRQAREVWERSLPVWQAAPEDVAARWRIESEPLRVAARARATRRETAWAAVHRG